MDIIGLFLFILLALFLLVVGIKQKEFFWGIASASLFYIMSIIVWVDGITSSSLVMSSTLINGIGVIFFCIGTYLLFNVGLEVIK